MVYGINLYGFNNIYVFLWAAWAGLIALGMLVVFFGFTDGGFLHKLEEKWGIRDVDRQVDRDEQDH